MDYSKIKLDNERNQHVTKRLNRLNTWGFFKVLYRDNLWRLFGYNFIMLLCIVPIYLIYGVGQSANARISASLPMLSGFGFSTGIWTGVNDYSQSLISVSNGSTVLLMALCSLALVIMFCGGFAVIRDAFWTGKLSTVGVIRSIIKGFGASFVYAFCANIVMSGTVFGCYKFLVWSLVAMPKWLAVILFILLCMIAVLVFVYCLILCSVAVTYKQSVSQTLSDSWRLMWLNIVPNIAHFVIALIPLGLFFLFNGSLLQTIFMVLIFMFGGMFFPLVWQTHMMKTFALFHPVESKKKSSKAKVDEVSVQPIAE